MAVRSKEEILEYLKGKMGDEPDDESISFLEDVTDTISDYESKVSESVSLVGNQKVHQTQTQQTQVVNMNL